MKRYCEIDIIKSTDHHHYIFDIGTILEDAPYEWHNLITFEGYKVDICKYGHASRLTSSVVLQTFDNWLKHEKKILPHSNP